MTIKAFHDPYRDVIDQFNRYGVRYVVVGMSGINYYATQPSQTFATMDYDIFLEPTLKNLEKALRCLTRLGLTVGTSEGVLKEKGLKAIAREKTTLIATTPEGLAVELLLAVSGYTFSELTHDAATFTVQKVPVKVGRLTKLLRSKQVAGRPKDRQFLQRYRSLLQEDS